MAERTSAERSIKRCFSLDAQKLSTVWDIVKENGKEPSIQYWCSDQTQIETEHLDRLINFPNTRLRSIYKIKLTNAYRPPLHVDVTFSNEPELEYHIDGDDDKVISVKHKLDELLLSTTKIYPVFQFPPMGLNASLTLVVVTISQLGLALVLSAPLSQLILQLFSSSSQVSPAPAVFGTLLLIFWFCTPLTLRFARWAFPFASFELGDGTQRSQAAAARRKGIIAILFGGIGVGLLVAWLAGKLFS